MKVIGTDNFARESVADFLVKDNLSEDDATKLAKEMNDKHCNHDYAPTHYIFVSDNYVLSRGMEDLV